MKEKETVLKSYREEIEVLVMELEVPTYELDDERRKFFPRYEDVLLRLFNNYRENEEMLKIENYHGSDAIVVHINLTKYLEDSYSGKEECINHLRDWFRGGLDVADEDIKVSIEKGYIYRVPEWENKISSFEGDKYIHNYIEWED